jgi:hypothetical protein
MHIQIFKNLVFSKKNATKTCIKAVYTAKEKMNCVNKAWDAGLWNTVSSGTFELNILLADMFSTALILIRGVTAIYKTN